MPKTPPTDNIINEFEEILEKEKSSANVSEEENLENLKKERHPNWGGKREGGGMKKGQKTKKTIENKIAEEYIRKRIIGALPNIVSAQMSLAKGCQYLFKIEKEYSEKQNKWYVPKGRQPKIVKDKNEIAAYLAGEYDDKDEADYYFMTTDKPENKALDSLLDRTFGKATQKSEVKLGITLSDLIDELNGEEPEDNEV